MELRPADWEDRLLLYQWRVQDELDNAWWQGTPITLEAHAMWLRQRLASPAVQIWVAEETVPVATSGSTNVKRLLPVGQARVDSNGELSYSIDKQYRRHGFGTQLVTQVLERTPHSRLKASVDTCNKAGRLTLEKAGFVHREDVRFYLWRDQ